MAINTVGLSGRSNMAWSHNGDWLAYEYGYSLRLVPNNQWDAVQEIYRADDPWDLEGGYLAWSPDDAAIGLVLGKYVETNGRPAEPYLAQVDRQRRLLSFLTPEHAIFSDWSTTNEIVAWGNPDWGVYDAPALTWHPIVFPDAIASQYHLYGATWATPEQLLWAGYTGPYPSGTREFTLFTLDWLSGEWDTLPVKASGTGAFRPFPVASPDGLWIAWIEDRLDFDPRTWRIMLYDRKDGRVVQAASSRDYGQSIWTDLTWAPDSKRLAFATERAGDTSHMRTIWILHLDSVR